MSSRTCRGLSVLRRGGGHLEQGKHKQSASIPLFQSPLIDGWTSITRPSRGGKLPPFHCIHVPLATRVPVSSSRAVVHIGFCQHPPQQMLDQASYWSSTLAATCAYLSSRAMLRCIFHSSSCATRRCEQCVQAVRKTARYEDGPNLRKRKDWPSLIELGVCNQI